MGGSQEPEMGTGGGGFTPCKAEQPPRGMELQEKKQRGANPIFYEDLH